MLIFYSVFQLACAKKTFIQGGKAEQKAGNIQCKQDAKHLQFKSPAGFRPFLWTKINCGKIPVRDLSLLSSFSLPMTVLIILGCQQMLVSLTAESTQDSP